MKKFEREYPSEEYSKTQKDNHEKKNKIQKWFGTFEKTKKAKEDYEI